MAMWMMFVAALLQDNAPPPGITVTATGTAKVAPTAYQFSFPMEAKGPDIAKAAEALEARRKALVEKLKALGVKETDVQVGQPELRAKASEADPRRVVSNRLKKRKADEKEAKEPVVLETWMTARLPLTQKEGAPLLIEVEQIKEKIKQAELIEKKSAKEEESDEVPEEMVPPSMRAPTGFDMIRFYFYAKPDESVSKEAASKALAKARRTADLTAQGAGKTLGDPMRVELHESGGRMMSYEEMYEYERYGRRGVRLPGQDEDALLASNPEDLKAVVTLRVTYSFK